MKDIEIKSICGNYKNPDFSELSENDVICFESKVIENHIKNIRNIQYRDLTYKDINKIKELEIREDAQSINSLEGLQYCVSLTSLKIDVKNQQDIITTSFFNPISSLDLSSISLNGLGLTNINFLVNFKNLKFLTLNNNNISNASPITKIKQLISVSLVNNKISEIPDLENLSYVFLDFSSNPLDNYAGLKNVSINDLHLNDVGLSDLSIFSKDMYIRHFNGSSNAIEDITGLENKEELESLTLGDNLISDATALENLDKLRYLNLYSNSISDMSFVSLLTNIKSVSLSYNKITNIPPLEATMTSLDLRHNKVSNLQNIVNYKELLELSIGHNDLTDISVIKETNIGVLYANNNLIVELPTLTDFDNLSLLSLGNNKINNISHVELGSSIKQITFWNNPIPKDQQKNMLSKYKDRDIFIGFDDI